MKFDILNFYSSIKYDELEKAVEFAREIIKHTCISVLSDADGSNWMKASKEMFDLAMSSYMGAELCDLIGLYIFNDLRKILVDNLYGIYRDDGLVIPKNKSSCEQKIIT